MREAAKANKLALEFRRVQGVAPLARPVGKNNSSRLVTHPGSFFPNNRHGRGAGTPYMPPLANFAERSACLRTMLWAGGCVVFLWIPVWLGCVPLVLPLPKTKVHKCFRNSKASAITTMETVRKWCTIP